MKTILVDTDKIYIGRITDNEVREFAMDISSLIECMEEGYSISASACLPSQSDEEAYPISHDYLRVEGNRLYWIPTTADTQEQGYGKFQAHLYDNEGRRVNSIIWRTAIGKTLGDTGEAPEPYEPFLEEMEGIRDSILNMLTPPAEDGYYLLRAVVSDGQATFEWEALS